MRRSAPHPASASSTWVAARASTAPELLEEVGPSGSVVGVASSSAMLELAARRCAGHDNVQLHEADAGSLPVDDESFDAAACVQVLGYVADPTAGLAEINRALRSGGRLVVWDIDWATVSLDSEDPTRSLRQSVGALGPRPLRQRRRLKSRRCFYLRAAARCSRFHGVRAKLTRSKSVAEPCRGHG